MQRKSLWGSYKSIPPKTRMYLGLGKKKEEQFHRTLFTSKTLGGMVFSTVGIFIADIIENQKPATALDKQELELMSPIVVVDHKKES